MGGWTYDGAKLWSLRMVSINCFKETARAIHRSSMVALCCSQSEDDTGGARGGPRPDANLSSCCMATVETDRRDWTVSSAGGGVLKSVDC